MSPASGENFWISNSSSLSINWSKLPPTGQSSKSIFQFTQALLSHGKIPCFETVKISYNTRPRLNFPFKKLALSRMNQKYQIAQTCQ